MGAIFIGIDLGTSGCRVYAVNSQNHIVAKDHCGFPDSQTIDAHIVQNPIDWWHCCQNVLTNVLREINIAHVKAIAVDGTSGTVLLCKKDGTPISKGYMYNDDACGFEASIIAQVAPTESGAHGATSGLAKCLFLKKTFNVDNAICLNQADWIAGKLLNRFDSSDENNALKMGYDPINRQWPSWLNSLKCQPILPKKIFPPGETSGTIDFAMAKQFNLPTDTRIIAGTTDSIAAFIATGCHKIGEAVTSLGSTLAIKLISDKPIFAAEFGVYSHRLGEQWLVGGASNTGGAVLKAYFSDEEIKKLSSQIDSKNLSNLDYYPLVKPGERFPLCDPLKTPILNPRPTSNLLFFQGILEGIAKIEKMAFDKLMELGAPYPTRIVTMGGGSRNEGWRQIRQKTFQQIPVCNATNTEAAFGAAILAKQNNI